MGAYFYHTTITKKGLLGIILVVAGSFSYAMERIAINRQEEIKDKNAAKELLASDNQTDVEKDSMSDD